MDYKIIKELGRGLYGIVYLVEYKGQKYALKRQKILESHLEKNYKSKAWRELDFVNYTSQFPNFFLKLYKYQFIENCEHNNKNKTKRVPLNEIEYFNSVKNSKWCVEFMYELKDGLLSKLLKKLSLNETYSMLIQVIYAIYLIQKEGYYHTDICPQNIMYTNTNVTHLKILDFHIPTFGFIYTIIDYGEVVHFKYDLSETEDHKYKLYLENTDIYYLIDILFDFGDVLEKYVGDQNELVLNELEDLPKKGVVPNSDLIYIFLNRKNPVKIVNYLSSKLVKNSF
jgi:serine/threonine protein kinase